MVIFDLSNVGRHEIHVTLCYSVYADYGKKTSLEIFTRHLQTVKYATAKRRISARFNDKTNLYVLLDYLANSIES